VLGAPISLADFLALALPGFALDVGRFLGTGQR
jgi:hypothetical protein